jgi:uncharacterized membrane protein
MSDTERPQPRHRRNWTRIALIAVLLLSLLGNAVALGSALRYRSLRDSFVDRGALAVSLPPEIRRELRDALIDARPTLRPLLRDLAASRRTMIAAAVATDFDRAALDAEMTAFRGRLDTLLVAVQGVLLDRLQARAAGD